MTTNKAFIGAYNKGRKAFSEYGDEAGCPYEDKRGGKHGQVITYSRTFRKFWFEGKADEKEGLPHRYNAVEQS